MREISSVILSILGLNLLKNFQTVAGENRVNGKNDTGWEECLPFNKVAGGELIDIKEAPFMLAVESSVTANIWRFHCGATIISQQIALTASHCVGFTDNVRVRAGSTKRQKDGDVYYVKKFVKHPPSTKNRYDYDIALIFLEDYFEFSDSVQPLKLPVKELQGGTLAMTAGYGISARKLKSFKRQTTGHLRRTTVPIIDRKVCYDVMEKLLKDRNINITSFEIITKTMVCAGFPGGKYDSCKGDSGGPLYLEGTVYGITSWGIGCALPCSPGVYSNVYGYLDWINKTIKENTNYDSSEEFF